jgi:hypothetical protein
LLARQRGREKKDEHMMRWSIWLVASCFLLAAHVGCNKENKRWEAAQETADKQTEAKGSAPSPKAAEGDQLNKFFPADGVDGFKRTFEQEKDGFVQAKYTKEGADATLSISDLVQNESARKKFAEAPEKLGDAPLTTIGKNQSTALVADRWQVKVSSQQLDHAARKALLERFDLEHLRSFNPATN